MGTAEVLKTDPTDLSRKSHATCLVQNQQVCAKHTTQNLATYIDLFWTGNFRGPLSSPTPQGGRPLFGRRSVPTVPRRGCPGGFLPRESWCRVPHVFRDRARARAGDWGLKTGSWDRDENKTTREGQDCDSEPIPVHAQYASVGS